MSERVYKGESFLSLPDDDYTVIDIETTGLDPSFDEIIELAAIRVRDGNIADSFSSLVKPTHEVSDFISALTGIDNDMLSDAPTIHEVLPKYIEFIGDDIVIGHNVNFDINFLYDACTKNLSYPFPNDFLDTLRISRKKIVDIKSHSLGSLLNYFDIRQEQAHRALNDCDATKRLYERLAEIKGASDLSVKEILSKLSGEKLESAREYFKGKRVCVKRLHEGINTVTAISVIRELGGQAFDCFLKDCDILCLSNLVYKKYIRYNPYDRSRIVEKAKLLHETNGLAVISENDLLEILNLPTVCKKAKNVLAYIEKQDGFEDVESPFYGKTCVFTGTLTGMQRKDAMQIVLNIGGKCSNSVTAKTDYLILGTQDYTRIKGQKSSKQIKAESLILKGANISILSESVFFDMLGE